MSQTPVDWAKLFRHPSSEMESPDAPVGATAAETDASGNGVTVAAASEWATGITSASRKTASRVIASERTPRQRCQTAAKRSACVMANVLMRSPQSYRPP